MSRRPRLVGLLWRWHRRIGLLAALFALLLATTGIVLNHSPWLGLDRRFVDWGWLLHAYGDDSGTLPAYQVGEQWLSRAANGRVYLDAQEVAPCQGELVGALRDGVLLYAACAREVLLISGDGELIEAFSSSTGLPAPVQGIGRVADSVVIQNNEGWWLADLDRVDFTTRAPAGSLIQQLAPGTLPQLLQSAIPAQLEWLTWERLLLDLHSGRVFGRPGVLLIDAAGVLLGCLALSGIGMWWLHRRRRTKTNP
jgi:hypothetical protein